MEEYQANARKGVTLNEDQQSAVSKYDEVLRTLELTKEMEKSFIGLANDVCDTDSSFPFISQPRKFLLI